MPLFGPNIKKMKEKRDIQGLIKELRNKNLEVRIEAVKALNELENVEGLVEAARNNEPKVCIEAVKSLGILKHIDELLEALKNKNPEVRISTIAALKSIGNAKAIEPLIITLTTDNVKAVQEKAFEALSTFGIREQEVWISMAKKLLESKNYQLALNCFEKATEIKPEDKETIGLIGVMLTEYDRYEDALKYSERLILIDPTDARAWALKGICLVNLGKIEEALSYCQKALEIDPELKGARDIIGSIYYKKHDYEALASFAQETLQLDPTDIKARLMLSEALVFANKLAEAEAEARRALKFLQQQDYIKPEDLSMVHQQIGIILAIRGFREEAIDELKKAVRANQQDQWGYKLLDAYLILDMMGSAMKGTPLERRARLLSLAEKRAKAYTSFAQWEAEWREYI